VTVHVPAATGVAVEPDTVHTAGVLEANDTGSRELADADRVTGSPAFVPGSGAKVIVCGFFPAAFTWNDCATSGAAP
jgi:hydrogenase maturation factor